MTLSKSELKVLLIVMENIDKIIYNYERFTECETITSSFDIELQSNKIIEIQDCDNNRNIAMAMEDYIVYKYKWNADTMLFDAGTKDKKRLLFFDIVYMLEYLVHRLKEETK